MIKADDGTRNQEITELYLEKLNLLMQEKKSSINRLNNYDGLLIGPKVANHEVVSIPFKCQRVNLLILRESIMVDNK